MRHAEVVLGGGVSGANIINIVSPEKGGRLPWQLDDKKEVWLLVEGIPQRGASSNDYLFPDKIELKNRCGKQSA